MPALRLLFADQLSMTLSALEDCDRNSDIILMCEIISEVTYVKHHKKKIAFLFSAMRHFSLELLSAGYNVRYVKLDDPRNTGSFKSEVTRHLSNEKMDNIVITSPSEYRLFEEIKSWQNSFSVPITILPDTRFLCSNEEFETWCKGRKQIRMEYFYRDMRKRYNVLMDIDEPIGGQWNYDSENRKPPKEGLNIPATYKSKIDSLTQEVLELVSNNFNNHFGDLEPFHYAVTRTEAKAALMRFIEERLMYFGDYQDAMVEGEPWMYHAHVGLYLNCGLLTPLECVRAAEMAYFQGKAPINAVEGFIRQIIGWREYVKGIYWNKMPSYAEENYLNASAPLPEFYWTADTEMNCIKQCIIETRKNAYAHHIQRLMVLGNFALIAGLSPKAVNEWFLIVYADAYEWVELPNVSGMVLFADGGFLASKPYAAGGSYINKMSNYCKNCRYKVSVKNGTEACPFNYLYWDFLARNREKLAKNPRVGMMYRTYDRMAETKKKAIQQDSRHFLNSISV